MIIIKDLLSSRTCLRCEAFPNGGGTLWCVGCMFDHVNVCRAEEGLPAHTAEEFAKMMKYFPKDTAKLCKERGIV